MPAVPCADSETVCVQFPPDATAAEPLHRQLLSEWIGASAPLVLDLARCNRLSGRTLALLQMTRNTADASGRSLEIRLGHANWKEFRAVCGLSEVTSEN